MSLSDGVLSASDTFTVALRCGYPKRKGAECCRLVSGEERRGESERPWSYIIIFSALHGWGGLRYYVASLCYK